MDKYSKCIIWITILCLIQDYGSCSDILEGPKNFTVLSGLNANFMCTVRSGWEVISWYLQTYFIVNIYPTGTTVSKDHTIIVQNSTNSITGAFTSSITIVNVNKSNSGLVRCSSLSASFQDAYLSVQGSSSSLSQTDIILIAVFGSLGGLLLLALIIVLIIYCRKKKKKKSERGYQSDAWKTRESGNSLRTLDKDNLGEHNLAYAPEPVIVRQSFGSIHRSNSAYYDGISTSTVSSSQVPAQKRTDNRPKTIRHVTHV